MLDFVLKVKLLCLESQYLFEISNSVT